MLNFKLLIEQIISAIYFSQIYKTGDIISKMRVFNLLLFS